MDVKHARGSLGRKRYLCSGLPDLSKNVPHTHTLSPRLHFHFVCRDMFLHKLQKRRGGKEKKGRRDGVKKKEERKEN